MAGNKRLKSIAACMLAAVILLHGCAGFAEGTEQKADYSRLIRDLTNARDSTAQVEADLEAMQDNELAAFIASTWQELFMDPEYRVYINGKDDPAVLQITGAHAFVVLGYALKNGEMTEELKERCDAAAAAWREFPDSILVCSGGPTGENNPEKHTEAGMMKLYLAETCGIPADSIYTDESAMTTVDNAMNTFGILKEQWIEEITLVTSSYHQRWANLLYTVLAEYIRETEGRTISVVSNFSCEREAPGNLAGKESGIAARQLDEMLKRLLSNGK